MSNTVPLPPATEMQQAILQHHGAAFADFPAQPAPAPESDEPVYRAALAACSALGFIAQDAGCLARAWAAQTRRLGFFDAAHWPDEPADFGLQPRPHAQPFAAPQPSACADPQTPGPTTRETTSPNKAARQATTAQWLQRQLQSPVLHDDNAG